MKIKKMSKKLDLKKDTVANIGFEEMNNIKGGDSAWCSDAHSHCVGLSYCGSIDPCSKG